MRISAGKAMVLAAVGALAGASGPAQQPGRLGRLSTDVAVTYNAELAQRAPGNCCFWLNGGAADTAATFYRGVGIAVAFDGGHAGNIAQGVDANKIDFTAGPRFTHAAPGWVSSITHVKTLTYFGEGLFGVTHAFDGVFPQGSLTAPSATSFAIKTGGGINLSLGGNVGLRLLQADYVRTALPDNAANSQNDLSLGFGFTWHVAGPRPGK